MPTRNAVPAEYSDPNAWSGYKPNQDKVDELMTDVIQVFLDDLPVRLAAIRDAVTRAPWPVFFCWQPSPPT